MYDGTTIPGKLPEAPPEKGSDWLAWLRWAALMVATIIAVWQSSIATQTASENQKAMQMVSAKLAKMEFMTPASTGGNP
jgi:hypothetical protein